MKYFIDGNQLVITKDDFINLQECPAVFIPLEDKQAKVIMKDGVLGLPIGELRIIKNQLDKQDRCFVCGYTRMLCNCWQ